jgi:hypothetical protein
VCSEQAQLKKFWRDGELGQFAKIQWQRPTPRVLPTMNCNVGRNVTAIWEIECLFCHRKFWHLGEKSYRRKKSCSFANDGECFLGNLRNAKRNSLCKSPSDEILRKKKRVKRLLAEKK